jgi:hypothetical protein
MNPDPLDPTDDDLRRRYQAAAESDGAHVDESVWERLACGELDDAARARAAEHITSCAACATVYRAVSELRSEAQRFDSGAPAPDVRDRARPAWFTSWPGALAAAAVLVLALVGTYRRIGDEPSSTTRAGTGAGVTTIAPAATAPARPAPDFRWAPVAGADRYQLKLNAADGLPLWTSPDLTTTATGWPPSVTVMPGTYFWQVIAFRDDQEVAASPLVRLDLTR